MLKVTLFERKNKKVFRPQRLTLFLELRWSIKWKKYLFAIQSITREIVRPTILPSESDNKKAEFLSIGPFSNMMSVELL